jgi:hypothetical protein
VCLPGHAHADHEDVGVVGLNGGEEGLIFGVVGLGVEVAVGGGDV